MITSKPEMLAAVEEVFNQIREGWTCYDGLSDPADPSAPVAHYAQLSKKLVTVIRGDPDEIEARKFLFRMLPFIEDSSLQRVKYLRRRKYQPPFLSKE